MLIKEPWILILSIALLIVIGDVVDEKNLKYYQSKTGRYLMQSRTTATCCECLDSMKNTTINEKK